MTSEDYEREKTYYIKLKSSISKIVTDLNSFNTNIDTIKNRTVGVYTVNGENTPIISRLTKLDNSSSQVRSYLKKTIIPAIDSAIRECDAQIDKLKVAEKAAAAKAAAAKATSIDG